MEISKVLEDFPVLSRKIKETKRLVYLDSAATSQKPTAMVQAMSDYYFRNNANVHRGIHTLAEEATHMYEVARSKIAGFLKVKDSSQIIFTRNKSCYFA